MSLFFFPGAGGGGYVVCFSSGVPFRPNIPSEGSESHFLLFMIVPDKECLSLLLTTITVSEFLLLC